MDQFLISLPTGEWRIEFYVFYIFCFFVFIQLLYIFVIYIRLAFYKDSKIQTQSVLPSISIIIVTHNQSNNLSVNLKKILQQNYPNFEVIVVSNQSTDETSYVLSQYQQNYSNFKHISIEPSVHLSIDKTLPLNLALKKVHSQYVLFTEADCFPNSTDYLLELTKHLSDNKIVVLGYATPQPENSSLNRLIRIDTAWQAFNYLSFALAKCPYLTHGRNFLCAREVFSKSLNIQNSNDGMYPYSDIFIGQITEGKRYSISISDSSRLSFLSPSRWNDWVHEKNESFSLIARLNFFKSLLVRMYSLSLWFMYVSFIWLFIYQEDFLISFVIFATVLCFKWIIQGRCFFKLKENKIAMLFPIYDVVFSMFMPLIYYCFGTKKQKAVNE